MHVSSAGFVSFICKFYGEPSYNGSYPKYGFLLICSISTVWVSDAHGRARSSPSGPGLWVCGVSHESSSRHEERHWSSKHGTCIILNIQEGAVCWFDREVTSAFSNREKKKKSSYYLFKTPFRCALLSINVLADECAVMFKWSLLKLWNVWQQ